MEVSRDTSTEVPYGDLKLSNNKTPKCTKRKIYISISSIVASIIIILTIILTNTKKDDKPLEPLGDLSYLQSQALKDQINKTNPNF